LAPSVPIWCTTLPQSWFGETPPPAAHWPPPAAELSQMRAWDAAAAPWTDGFDKARYGGLLPAIKAAGAEVWFPYYPDLTEQTRADATRLGLRTAAWTVNTTQEMQHLIELGVSAICTDYPDRLKALLAP
jgi:glycerophosphoryl diester phosphodiesterase